MIWDCKSGTKTAVSSRFAEIRVRG